MTEEASPDHWSIDSRLPLGLLIGLAIQTVIFSFWMGTLSTQVTQNKNDILKKEADASRITVVETEMDSINASLVRLTNTIDRLLQETRNLHPGGDRWRGQKH